MARYGFGGAKDRIRAIAKVKPVSRKLQRAARQAPLKAKTALAKAVTPWHATAVKHVPVRGSTKPGAYRKYGRGQLKKRTQPFIETRNGVVTGGVRSMTPYAWWLLAGTRTIAGGDVMRWKPGQGLIPSWPAKSAGGGPNGAMPIIVPWLPKARDDYVAELEKTILQ